MSTKLNLKARQAQSFRMGQVVNLMQMNVDEMEAHLSDAARDNPMFIFRRRGANGGVTDILETTAAEACHSLYAHVYSELAGLIAQGGLMETVITALIEELEPSGWLGAGPEKIAGDLGLSTALVETALKVVQKRVEPAGLFARNLEECLRLQLEDRDAVTPEIHLVLSNLDCLGQGGIPAIMQQTGLDEMRVRQCLDLLRTLDPKPASAFGFDHALQREPDVRVTLADDGRRIEYLSCGRNDVEVASLPRGNSPEAREALAQARALKQAYDLRHSALQLVVEALVDRQTVFFRNGYASLTPLTMRDIALATGFHLSTVSRVLNGLLIEGPNGIVAARTLFSGTASSQTVHSKAGVQALIKSLLAAEDPANPLTDRGLVVALKRQGVIVSRRVVSNYRQEIGVLSAPKRRALVQA